MLRKQFRSNFFQGKSWLMELNAVQKLIKHAKIWIEDLKTNLSVIYYS